MLMMLAFWGGGGRLIKRFAADAHDAGLLGGRWLKRFAADAHDAGLLGGDGYNGLQLMLMMLAFWGAMDKTVCS